ncbi:MAG: hypothetical protein ACI9N1_001690 [Flavobacteriales bacterium]|jgi:hypothetical protein
MSQLGLKPTKISNILLFGTGCHAKVCIDIVESQGTYNIIGIIDSIAKVGAEKYGYTILGTQNELSEIVDKYNVSLWLIAIGDNYVRKLIFDAVVIEVPHFDFVNIIADRSVLAASVQVGRGNMILKGVIINYQTSVGDFCLFNSGSRIEHDSKFDDFSQISAGSISRFREVRYTGYWFCSCGSNSLWRK